MLSVHIDNLIFFKYCFLVNCWGQTVPSIFSHLVQQLAHTHPYKKDVWRCDAAMIKPIEPDAGFHPHHAIAGSHKWPTVIFYIQMYVLVNITENCQNHVFFPDFVNLNEIPSFSGPGKHIFKFLAFSRFPGWLGTLIITANQCRGSRAS